jgi:hypothetical protein
VASNVPARTAITRALSWSEGMINDATDS